MIMTGLARVGRDVEVRQAGADKVASISLAFNFGKKDADNKRPTQWVEASLWGKRAETLAPYLKKGQLVDVVLEEPHIEEYEGRSGPGHKLVGRVMSIELAGGRPEGQQAASGAPAQQRTAAPAAAPASGVEDDDIPF